MISAASFSARLKNLKKTTYQSIYYDYYNQSDHVFLDNFTPECFDRLLSMVYNARHRLVISVARSVLKIIFGHKKIANYDITIITKTGLGSPLFNDISMNPHPMYSVTEGSKCHKMLQDYDLSSTQQPNMTKGENSNGGSDKYVRDFVNSFENVEDVLFIVLKGNTFRSEVPKKGASKKRKQSKSKSKVTFYTDDESRSLLVKLSRHQYRISFYLGKNVQKESP